MSNKKIIAAALVALLSMCAYKPTYDEWLIIGKSANIKPSGWTCISDSLTVVKNLRTKERGTRCGNLGNIGDTIAELKE